MYPTTIKMSALDEFNYHDLPIYIQHIISAILQGNLESLKNLVQIAESKGLPIGWWWEPYANIQSKSQLGCLQYLMDRPSFRFDAAFVCASCYFTPRGIRTLIFRHPRALRYILDPKSLEIEASEAYQKKGFKTYLGVNQRIYYASDEANRHHRLLEKLRATVVLNSFFTICSRIIREEYYAPGGKGYLKGKASFEASICTA